MASAYPLGRMGQPTQFTAPSKGTVQDRWNSHAPRRWGKVADIVEPLAAGRVAPDPGRNAACTTSLEERVRRFIGDGFDVLPVGTALLSAEDRRILRANRAWCEAFGVREQDLVGRTNDELTHPDDLAESLQRGEALRHDEAGVIAAEKRIRHAERGWLWVRLWVTLVRDEAGEPLFYCSQLQDISDHKRLQVELEHLALHDPLTGLSNRARLAACIASATAALPTDGTQRVGLAFVDLDGFKEVNDLHGHAVGDSVLQGAAHRLLELFGDDHTVARVGGDEMVVLMTQLADDADAAGIAELIVYELSQPFAAAPAVQLRASVGVAVTPRPCGADELLATADRAMYEAKRSGGQTWRIAVVDDAP